jgi:hypothetical protein
MPRRPNVQPVQIEYKVPEPDLNWDKPYKRQLTAFEIHTCKGVFLKILAETNSVREAIRCANVPRSMILKWRETDEAFRDAWADFEGAQTDHVHDKLYEIATSAGVSAATALQAATVWLNAHHPEFAYKGTKANGEQAGSLGSGVVVNIYQAQDPRLPPKQLAASTGGEIVIVDENN